MIHQCITGHHPSLRSISCLLPSISRLSTYSQSTEGTNSSSLTPASVPLVRNVSHLFLFVWLPAASSACDEDSDCAPTKVSVRRLRDTENKGNFVAAGPITLALLSQFALPLLSSSLRSLAFHLNSHPPASAVFSTRTKRAPTVNIEIFMSRYHRTTGLVSNAEESPSNGIPIPSESHPLQLPSSATSSRNATPSSSYSSSISGSLRHHPYSSSSRSGRPRSAASASSRSEASETTEDDGHESLSEDIDIGSMDLDDSFDIQVIPPTPLSHQLPSFSLAAPGAHEQGPPARPKPKTSHARKQSPDHIKRPPNAFIIFRSHCCNPAESGEAADAPGTPSAKQLAELGITDHRHISRISSHLWKSLLPQEKAYWEKRAQDKKEEHQRLYPNYKYKPVFRNKDEVRRRRHHNKSEQEQEKRGCEDVARALLEAPELLITPSTSQPTISGNGVIRGRGSSGPGFDSSTGDAEPKTRGGRERRVERAQRARRVEREEEKEPDEEQEFRKSQITVSDAPPSRWTLDQVKALSPESLSPPKQRRSKRKQDITIPASAFIFQDGLTHPTPAFHLHSPGATGPADSGHSDDPTFRPHTAPASGDFAQGTGRRRSSQPRSSGHHSHSASCNDSGNVFTYMELLDSTTAQLHQMPPDLHDFQRSRTASPLAYASLNSHLSTPFIPSPLQIPQALPTSASPMAIQHLPHSHRESSPLTGESLPHNPAFLYYGHPNEHGYPIHPPLPPSQLPPLSPRSLGAPPLDNYKISASTSTTSVALHQSFQPDDIIISPTSTTFTFNDGVPNQVLPLSSRRRGPDAGTLDLTLVGMKRRGTLGRTAQGGDLMLISPTAGSFGGRKHSLGRWEIRKISMDQGMVDGAKRQGGHPLSGDTTEGGHNKCAPPPPFQLGQSEFFVNPSPVLNINPQVTHQEYSFARPSVDLSRSSLFNYAGPQDVARAPPESQHRPSLDSILAAEIFDHYDLYASQQPQVDVAPSQEWMTNNQLHRGSDATIRWRPNEREDEEQPQAELGGDETIRISALSRTREDALAVLHQASQIPDAEDGLKYIYLAKELASDHALVEQILQQGFGVTYDHGEPAASTEPFLPLEDSTRGYPPSHPHHPASYNTNF
ncbi:hypothetical protein T439DRAFT_363427 [Meredithblackwellia eburnea MCA 4105]